MKEIALGIDIGGTTIKSAFVDKEGHLLHKFVIPVPYHEDQYLTLKRLSEAIRKAIEALPEDEKLVGIGCGCPGAINTFKGTCDYSNNLGWRDLPVAKILEESLHFPVTIDNDANAAMLGEIRFGCGKKFHNAILLTLGTGVGGGLYLNDRLYVGNEGKGAELGHMVVFAGGRTCTCGRKGCLEAYASASALIQETKEAMNENPDSLMWKRCPDIHNVGGALAFECAKEGDESAKKVVANYISYLGEGILNFVNIFRPEAIILSGGVSKQGENLRKPLVQFLEERGYGFGSKWCPKVEILVSSLGADMGIYGAAAIGFENAKRIENR